MSTAARRDSLVLIRLAAVISFGALIIYYRRGAVLLYGDAVAHINIAHRVFDSRTPGIFQLGTVWLPLPHLLNIPFVMNDYLWRTGLGASVPSMIAYLAGALGIFRLVLGLASRRAAWIAAAVYVLNPNLIYMQATAMTESLYLAFFIWAVVYFAEFVQEIKDDPVLAAKRLEKCALTVAAAMLVRYDGWFLAGVIAPAVLLVLLRSGNFSLFRRSFVDLVLLFGLTGALFLAYNYGAYGNPLEFANGQYSPRAIQERSRTATMPTYPGEHSLRDATLQFLKTSRLNVGESRAEYLLFVPALIAVLAAIYFSRRYLPWIILLAPLPFYVLCIAWGSVPVYHPEWWPFSYYNVRYGLQLLPAIAVFFALACEFAANFIGYRTVSWAAALLIGLSCFSVWYKTPICLREAQANGGDRLALELQLADMLKPLPKSATLLMCDAHSGALELAGIHGRRVLNESNTPLWQQALTQPAHSADYVIAFPGDDVARAVKLFPQDLEQVATIGTPSQPKALIYRSRH
jgi:4-amino-4-deoxy-L-arabinose transferase-like glycosyltransferase